MAAALNDDGVVEAPLVWWWHLIGVIGGALCVLLVHALHASLQQALFAVAPLVVYAAVSIPLVRIGNAGRFAGRGRAACMVGLFVALWPLLVAEALLWFWLAPNEAFVRGLPEVPVVVRYVYSGLSLILTAALATQATNTFIGLKLRPPRGEAVFVGLFWMVVLCALALWFGWRIGVADGELLTAGALGLVAGFAVAMYLLNGYDAGLSAGYDPDADELESPESANASGATTATSAQPAPLVGMKSPPRKNERTEAWFNNALEVLLRFGFVVGLYLLLPMTITFFVAHLLLGFAVEVALKVGVVAVVLTLTGILCLAANNARKERQERKSEQHTP